MHNTEIPLDMLFADSSFRVTGIVADAKPETDTLRGVDGPSQFVLEVNGGFCAKHQIKPGDHFNFQNFFPHASEYWRFKRSAAWSSVRSCRGKSS